MVWLKRALVLLGSLLLVAAVALVGGVLWPERLPEAPPSPQRLVIRSAPE